MQKDFIPAGDSTGAFGASGFQDFIPEKELKIEEVPAEPTIKEVIEEVKVELKKKK